MSYFSKLDDGRLRCEVCPRFCSLQDGQRGMCFVRAREGDRVVLSTYGRSSGFCIDPIEKKPLNHFLPGTPVLSFGTAGCNLACKFCQNWDISKSREIDTLADAASPEAIAEAAAQSGCSSVAFTYNDPVIFLEYAIDVAAACRARGIKTVAVTAGYICPAPRVEFYAAMDAANIDLKAFSESFYHKVTGAHLQPVLETIAYACHETDTWVELTTLLIPGENDSDAEIEAECAWIADRLGPDVPLHFTAFHPDYRMREHPQTPKSSLARARHIAQRHGLRYVYTGNVRDLGPVPKVALGTFRALLGHLLPKKPRNRTTMPTFFGQKLPPKSPRTAPITLWGQALEGATTFCHACSAELIARDGYSIARYGLDAAGRCRACGAACAGVFAEQPGTWGSRRQPLRLSLRQIDA